MWLKQLIDAHGLTAPQDTSTTGNICTASSLLRVHIISRLEYLIYWLYKYVLDIWIHFEELILQVNFISAAARDIEPAGR